MEICKTTEMLLKAKEDKKLSVLVAFPNKGLGPVVPTDPLISGKFLPYKIW